MLLDELPLFGQKEKKLTCYLDLETTFLLCYLFPILIKKKASNGCVKSPECHCWSPKLTCSPYSRITIYNEKKKQLIFFFL